MVKTFHPQVVAVVLASVGIGLQLYRMAFVSVPMAQLFDGYIKSSPHSSSNPLSILEPLFKHLVSNKIGKPLLTITGTFGAVMSTHFHITGGQVNPPPLFSPLITIATTLIGQLYGAGFTGPLLLPLRLALSNYLTPTDALTPAPAPTYYTVVTVALHFCVSGLAGGLTAVAPGSATWTYVNYAFTMFPFLFIPLALCPRSTPRTPPPRSNVYVFTGYKYLYTFLWWMSAVQGLTALRAGEPFTAECYWLAVDTVGMVLTFVGMYAIDYVAGDTAGFGIGKLALGMVLAGPAATAAAYYEGKHRKVLQRAVQKTL